VSAKIPSSSEVHRNFGAVTHFSVLSGTLRCFQALFGAPGTLVC